MSILRRLERRNHTLGVALVAAEEICEDRGLICKLAQATHLDGATLRPHLGRSGYENLGICKWTDDGPDVASIENGAGRDGGKILLQLHQRRPHLGNRSEERRVGKEGR